MVYKYGKRHLGADSLSCYPLPPDTHHSDPRYTADSTAFLDKLDMAGEQLTNPWLQPNMRYLSGDVTEASPRTMREAKLFHIRDRVLYRRNYEAHGRPWL